MRYLPHTAEDIDEMLAELGKARLDDLFEMIPENCRRRTELGLSPALTEWDLIERVDSLAATMATPPAYKLFMGAGSYAHFIPAAISYLLARSEFLTPYTPYQPEMAQGTLQGIYEYQTLTARLLGMEIANASLYDGASALAEALLMAMRITGRRHVAISALIHPLYRQVARTYLKPTGCRITQLSFDASGRTCIDLPADDDDLAAVALQSPNFFGCIEDLETWGEQVHACGALLIAAFSEPLAYGLFKNPGSQGADIACGEGQSLGIPRTFGGPGLGMFACKAKYVRNLPGRLVGETVDQAGNRGFVLTLATREQHIRRERATSNICTNNSFCALTAAMYMAALGRSGIRKLARLNYDKSEYLKKELAGAGFAIPFDAPTFNEFVVAGPDHFSKTYRRLLDRKIVAGLALGAYYPELENHYLLCVTETHTRTDIDTLIGEMQA